MMRRRHVLGLAAVGAATVLGGCGSATPPAAPGTPGPSTLRYGADPAQYAELHLPPGTASLPVVVVLHGGFWSDSYGLELGTPLAVDLANHGVAALNVEYRRLGAGGGFPATFDDVAAAIDALATAPERARLDPGRVVTLGHSAGGTLAVWAASRRPVRRAVSQAGVLDLVAAADQGLGGGAASDLMGGAPAAVPAAYASASPAALVPAPVEVVAVHGTEDTTVPLDQSERYVRVAGPRARLRLVDGADHFAMIDTASPAWAACREEVLRAPLP